jgi:isoamylase
MLIVFNSHHDVVTFTLPECRGGDSWYRLIDTNLPDEAPGTTFQNGDTYDVTGRSLLLFTMQKPNGGIAK